MTRLATRTLPLVLALSFAVPAARADVTVDTSADVDVDDGECALREAIVAANTNASYHGCIRTAAAVDAITFDLGPGTPTIAVTGSDLPTLSGPVVVDGATGGATRVEIAGGGTRSTGLSFLLGADATGSEIRNLVINGFASAELFLSNGSDFVVVGNLLGTDASGTSLVAGSGIGILVCAGSSCGTSDGHRMRGNVIVAGSTAAIQLGSSSSHVIQGNLINTNAAGTAALSGAFVGGIEVNNANGNLIGGANPGEGNVIVGFQGITIGGNTSGGQSSGTVIQGNSIGTDVTGTVALGGAGGGITLGHAVGTQVGGTVAGAGNLISGNGKGIVGGSSGVSGGKVDDTSVQGNLIGTDASGMAALGNTSIGVDLGDDAVIEGNVIAFNGADGIETNCVNCIQRISGNAIHSNGGIGIDLNGSSDGVTPNDADDADTGPNGRQNFPILEAVVFPGGTAISGTLESTPGTTFRVEIFANDACDPSGNGEGQQFVGARDDVTTDAGGDAVFTVALAETVPAGKVMTATAIAPDGSTSEFSPCTEPPPATTTTSTSTTSTSMTSTSATSTSTTSSSTSTMATTVTSSTYPPTTTTSTTANPSTTTTTTPPGNACARTPDGPTFRSLNCRLAALIDATGVAAALGDLRQKLSTPLGKAKARTELAETLCAGEHLRQAKARLKQVRRQLIQYAHRLRRRSAAANGPTEVREPLARTADAIHSDAVTLRKTLRCPADAS